MTERPTPLPDLVLGVDGGGSKTRALVADREGTVLGVGVSGSSNYHGVGLDGATQALEAAIGFARAQAERAIGAAPGSTLAAACFGLAGMDRAQDRELIADWASKAHIAARVEVVNDSELVLAAGTPSNWGVALICGTGSICCGRSPAGATARAGGWGYLLGDEGSGYNLAVEALRLATRTADGRAGARAILNAVLEHYHLDDPEQLLGLYRPDMTIAQIADLATRVLGLAERGDEHAAGLVDRAGVALARMVETVARKLELRKPPLALAGGVLRASRTLRSAIYEHAAIELGEATLVDDPAVGALAIARSLG